MFSLYRGSWPAGKPSTGAGGGECGPFAVTLPEAELCSVAFGDACPRKEDVASPLASLPRCATEAAAAPLRCSNALCGSSAPVLKNAFLLQQTSSLAREVL